MRLGICKISQRCTMPVSTEISPSSFLQKATREAMELLLMKTFKLACSLRLNCKVLCVKLTKTNKISGCSLAKF